jgi:hypothetical protein
VLALFRMAGDQDRAARHEQKRLDPLLRRDHHPGQATPDTGPPQVSDPRLCRGVSKS